MENLLEQHAPGQLPPMPKLTRAQQTFNWFMKPLELLTDCQRLLGSTFTLELDPIGIHVFFANPKTVAQILKADPVENYVTNDREFMQPLMGANSLFLLHSEKHLERRRILSPPFHANKIHQYGKTIQTLTLEACRRWQLDKPVKLLDYMFELSLDIIFVVIFGLTNVSNAETIKSLMQTILRINRAGATFFKDSRNTNTALGKMQEDFYTNKQQLEELLLGLIEEKRENLEGTATDILSLLLACRDENDQPLPATEIRDHLMTTLFAGHETTATAIAWAVYWILGNPDVKHKLDQEIAGAKNLAEIAANNYLQAVCQETLRIIPIIAIISRTLKKPMECEGYTLAEGTNISIPIYLLHRNSAIYSNPEIFNPNRFLEKKFAFNEFLPFGGGARICIGMSLAQYQMKIILATVLSYFDITLLDELSEKTIRKSIVIAPANSVTVKLAKKIAK